MDRDIRGYDTRLKQYETEIGDLKARCDAMTFDTNRRMEENEVSIALLIGQFSSSFTFSLFKFSTMIWKSKSLHSNVSWKTKRYYVLIWKIRTKLSVKN